MYKVANYQHETQTGVREQIFKLWCAPRPVLSDYITITKKVVL